MRDDQQDVLGSDRFDVHIVVTDPTDFSLFERPSYVLDTYKWGSGTRGTPGGTITWAAVTAGQSYPTRAEYTSQATGISAVFMSTIRAAFAAWDAVGNFSFVETTDPMTAGITVIFDELQARSANTIGLAYTYSTNAGSITNSYISFDIGRRYRLIDGTVQTVGSTSSNSSIDLYTLALHEIGHALGLNHEDSFVTVMSSIQSSAITDLTSDDIAGIRAIYGSPSVVPTTDDYPGSNLTTTTLTVGGSIIGRIDDATDQDWFRVTLTAGTIYRIDLRGYDSGNGTLLDPFVRLLDSLGSVLVSDDDSGVGTDSQILYSVTSTGTYYISAGAFGGEQGTYTLALTTATQADDYAASSSTTGTVTVGGAVTGRLETSTDTDWFAVSLVSGQSYRIDVRGSASNGGTLADPYVRLRSASGVVYAFDNDTGVGADAQVTYTAGFTGIHYVEAATLGSGIGTYTVSVATAAAASDDYAATTATTGVAAAGESALGNIETAGDRDWFRITLTGGASYRFDLRGSPSNGGTLADPYIVLRDAGGNQLAFDDDAGTGLDAQLSYSVTTTGTYFIEARSANTSGTGTYTLGVTLTAAPDDYLGSILTSGAVTPGAPGTAVSGTIGAAGDSDWFRAMLTAGTPYRFRLTNGTLASSHLNLRDVGGALVFSDSDGIGNPEILFTPTVSGTYYLDARAATSTGTGTYTVAVDDLSITDEYGATTATAGSMNVGATATGNIGTAGDVDWIRVSLLSGVLYRIDGRGSATGGGTLADPHLTLLNSSGAAILADTNSGEGADARLFYTAQSSGNYYIAMRAGSSSATGTYAVTVTASPDDYAASTATTGLTIGGIASGVVETPGDRDWFRTTLTAGLPYAIEVRGTAPGSALRWTDSSLVVRDNVGSVLNSATASGLGAAASLIFTPTATGVHFIDVLAYGSGVGSYAVSVALATAPASATEGDAASLPAADLAAITAPSSVDLREVPAVAAPLSLASPLTALPQFDIAEAFSPEDAHRLEAAARLDRLFQLQSGNPFELLPPV